MINADEYDIFKNNISTLKETSKDNHDGVDYYMTESEIKVINFDGVKKNYLLSLGFNKDLVKSNDALILEFDKTDTFIEFKNGNMKKEKTNVKLKVLDSLLIFTDIINKTVAYTRANMNYILVYNEEKNPENTISSNSVQESSSRNYIAKILLEEKAKKKYIRFGIERFESVYFKDIFTYTEKEFEDNFVRQQII